MELAGPISTGYTQFTRVTPPSPPPIDKALVLLWYDRQGYSAIVVVCYWSTRDSEIAPNFGGMPIPAN